MWLVDADGANANLDWTLTDATDVIAALRAEGKEVFVHCAEARSRTATVAALYAMRHKKIPYDLAWGDVATVLPYFDPARFHQAAVRRITEAPGPHSGTTPGFGSSIPGSPRPSR